jgi:hypothetical protein
LADPFDYRLERAFAAQIASLSEFVLRGDAEDWAAYKYLIGQIRGIQFAMDTLVGLRGKADTEEGI